jgi:hypothetical protein
MMTLLKLLGSWVAVSLSMVVGMALVNALHLHTNAMPDPTPDGVKFLAYLVSCTAMTLAVYAVARGLSGPAGLRAPVIAALVFVALGVNNILDGQIYTHAFDGAVPANVLLTAMAGIMAGGSLGLMFGHRELSRGLRPRGLRQMGSMSWAARGLGIWLAWPVIYFAFGMMVSPFVVRCYTSGIVPGFHIPSFGVIIPMQLLRSVLFLAVSLPVVALWKGSRLGLWVGLGLAHAVSVGWFGLIAGTFLPMVMRVGHGLEITGDSFAYAGLLVLLFSGAGVAREPVSTAPKQMPLQAH